MKFKITDDRVLVIKDGFEVAEINSDGFHVIQHNPTFNSVELIRILRKVEEMEG